MCECKTTLYTVVYITLKRIFQYEACEQDTFRQMVPHFMAKKKIPGKCNAKCRAFGFGVFRVTKKINEGWLFVYFCSQFQRICLSF